MSRCPGREAMPEGANPFRWIVATAAQIRAEHSAISQTQDLLRAHVHAARQKDYADQKAKRKTISAT